LYFKTRKQQIPHRLISASGQYFLLLVVPTSDCHRKNLSRVLGDDLEKMVPIRNGREAMEMFKESSEWGGSNRSISSVVFFFLEVL
jgi:hypothetical protein